jgi:peptidoglycan/LPS O-acetylase OafA/YrhL
MAHRFREGGADQTVPDRPQGIVSVREAPFISRPMSVWLDLVRALAALAVVVGHAVQFRVYTGWFPFTIMFQKNAVVVFFVLSGMVIAASVDRDRKTLGDFALARVSRILPVALAALAVSVAVAALDVDLAGPPMFAENLRWIDPGPTIRAALFLSESYGHEYELNSPYWSLCYEVWFYALFAAATYLRGWPRGLWLAGISIVTGPNILLLLPVWLVGLVLVRLPIARRTSQGAALALISVAIAGLVIIPRFAMDGYRLLRTLTPWDLGSALFAITDLLLAVAIAAGFAGLKTLADKGFAVPARAEAPIRWAANMSFSLYLLHWPLLKLVHLAGLTAGTNPLAFAAVIAGIVAVSGAFATVTEHKRFVVRDWIERLLRRRAPAVSAA